MKIKVLMLGAGFSVQGGITSVEKLILDNISSDVDICHIATFVKGSPLRNTGALLYSILVLSNCLITESVDLVHIHFAERGSTLRKLVLVPLLILFRKPFILHAHGAAYREFFDSLPKPAKLLVVFFFSKSTKFISLSDSWSKYFSEIFCLSQEQSIRLYNPVELPQKVPNRSNQKLVKFVFLGRIGKRGGALDIASKNLPKQDKGAFDLIAAFASLSNNERARAQLILAGNGNIEGAKKLVNDLNIQKHVVLHSWLDSTERDRLLEESSAFVLPSFHEGLPMSMLEAMAWGLPVIVTPVGGIPEIIKHNKNGLLVTPGDRKEISNALSRLIRDNTLRAYLGREARETVQDFCIDKYTHSLRDIYLSALK